jgi:glutamate synthase (NADPH/NADH) small chain
MSPAPLFTKTQAVAEAYRCLQCYDAPCIAACPASVNIPRFIRMIRTGNVSGASEELRSANAFVTLCGAVCPSSVLCRSRCTRGRVDRAINIGQLHRFVTASVPVKAFPDWPPARGPRVAVIGAGPAGLGCATTLLQRGFDVTVFEKESRVGGIAAFEIPKARAENALGQDLRAFAERLKIVTSKPIRSLKDFREFDAVFVAVGLGRPASLGIEGEDLLGVESASSFLRRAREKRPDVAGEKGIVVGGGNTAMSAAMVLLKAGVDVTIVYRRRQIDMPAWPEKVGEAVAAGIRFRFLENPVRVVGEEGRVVAVDVQRQEPGTPDATGRPKPIPVDGAVVRLPANRVIIAVGAGVEASIFAELARDEAGHLASGENNESSIPGVFVGGDAAHGEGTVVGAFAEGRRAAESIAKRLGAAT